MNKKEAIWLFARYFFIIVLGLPNLFLFYLIFTPPTIYATFFVLNNLYDAVLQSGTSTIACVFVESTPILSLLSGLACVDNVIFFKGYFANIIPACVAGAAYYLLLILNLTTPMPVRTRIMSIVFLFVSFLFINILRITIFAMLLFKGYQYFDLTHIATWYFGSTVMVILIWFSNVLIFRIRAIPIYSDVKNIHLDIRGKKK